MKIWVSADCGMMQCDPKQGVEDNLFILNLFLLNLFLHILNIFWCAHVC